MYLLKPRCSCLLINSQCLNKKSKTKNKKNIQTSKNKNKKNHMEAQNEQLNLSGKFQCTRRAESFLAVSLKVKPCTP